MSRYSGQFDFCDEVDMHGIENIANSKIYIGNNRVPISIKSEREAVPYYPYVISCCGWEQGCGTIHLSTTDAITTEEKRYGEMKIHRYFRKLWFDKMVEVGYKKDNARRWCKYYE